MISPMSNVHRLRDSDRIFFITANLSKNLSHLTKTEFAGLLRILESARCRLGFLLCGYVLMPDHWHALVFPRYPLTISRVLHGVSLSLPASSIQDGIEGEPSGNTSFGTASSAMPRNFGIAWNTCTAIQ